MKMATTLKNGRRVIITPPDDAKPGMPLKCKVPAIEAEAPASANPPAPAAKMVEDVKPRRAGAVAGDVAARVVRRRCAQGREERAAGGRAGEAGDDRLVESGIEGRRVDEHRGNG